jgi:DNA-directed RNA polymerase specialized sigma24 family protein
MPALLRTAYLLTGSQPDAEDLVQTALVRAVPRWSRIAGDPEPYLTEKETAALLGISVGTVKSQARDALARLRTVLPDRTDEPAQSGTPVHPGSSRPSREPLAER